jgi:adenosine deaminase
LDDVLIYSIAGIIAQVGKEGKLGFGSGMGATHLENADLGRAAWFVLKWWASRGVERGWLMAATAEGYGDWYDLVPKVELHLHLEGAIPHDALWALIQKYGGDPSVPDQQRLAERFVYRDFHHFLRTWCWKDRFLREAEDFVFVAEQVARDLVRQRIWYAEVFYSVHDLETGRLTEAIREGLSRVPEVEVALIADLVRDFGPQAAARRLDEVNEVRDQGVVGIGIGGSEADYPPALFAEVYARARRMGLHTTAHAGEAAGAASIWGALRSLAAERVGHGTRAAEDPALVDYLAERQIPLEMCPISNVRTGVVPDIASHPVRRYVDRGLAVTINSDDPKMFGNSLAQEYRLLHQACGFSQDEIRRCILQGVRASWLPEERKRALAERIQSDIHW